MLRELNDVTIAAALAAATEGTLEAHLWVLAETGGDKRLIRAWDLEGLSNVGKFRKVRDKGSQARPEV